MPLTGENLMQSRINYTVEAAFLFQPHVVVTVDSKGFSFRLLKLLRSKWGLRRCWGKFIFACTSSISAGSDTGKPQYIDE